MGATCGRHETSRGPIACHCPRAGPDVVVAVSQAEDESEGSGLDPLVGAVHHQAPEEHGPYRIRHVPPDPPGGCLPPAGDVRQECSAGLVLHGILAVSSTLPGFEARRLAREPDVPAKDLRISSDAAPPGTNTLSPNHPYGDLAARNTVEWTPGFDHVASPSNHQKRDGRCFLSLDADTALSVIQE